MAVIIHLVPSVRRAGTNACSSTSDLQLTLLVGQYAHRYYLDAGPKTSMTETVKAFSQYGPQFFPLPHPSWRSAIWMQKNPWFEEEVIPELRNVVRKLV